MKKSSQVANYLLKKALDRKDTLTPMQVLKLVYMCHGWMLGLYGRHLIREDVEAWKYGPVIRELYHDIKSHRSHAITSLLEVEGESPDFDEDEKDVIDQVYDNYYLYSGPELSRLTHMPSTPWDMTYNLSGQNSIISHDLIEEYYSNLAKEQEDVRSEDG